MSIGPDDVDQTGIGDGAGPGLGSADFADFDALSWARHGKIEELLEPLHAGVDPPAHPATVYFAQQLQRLSAGRAVRLPGGQRVRITPTRLAKMLEEQASELPISRTQLYRSYHGEAPPRVDVVCELAKLFGVSPREFLPPD